MTVKQPAGHSCPLAPPLYRVESSDQIDKDLDVVAAGRAEKAQR
jgi:hypothetical protein